MNDSSNHGAVWLLLEKGAALAGSHDPLSGSLNLFRKDAGEVDKALG